MILNQHQCNKVLLNRVDNAAIVESLIYYITVSQRICRLAGHKNHSRVPARILNSSLKKTGSSQEVGSIVSKTNPFIHLIFCWKIMVRVNRKTTFYFSFKRILGFFPYTWKVEEQKPTPNDFYRRHKLRLRKSAAWTLWSIFVTVVTSFMMFFEIFWIFKQSRGQFLHSSTFLLVQKIYDIVTALAVLSLQIINWLNSEKLANYILKFYKYDGPDIKGKKFSMAFLLLMFCVVIPVNSVAYFQYLAKEIHWLSMASFAYKSLVSVVLILSAVLSYESCMGYIAQNLDPILTWLEDEQQWNETVQNERKARYRTKSHIFCCKPTNETNPVTYNQYKKVDPYSPINYTEFTPDFDKIETTILHYFDIQNEVNDYLGTPIILVMSCLMVWMLANTFNISMLNQLPEILKLISIVNLVETTTTIIFISNSTNHLSKTVSKQYHYIWFD